MNYRHRQFSKVTLGIFMLGVVLNLIFWLAPESFLNQLFSLKEVFNTTSPYWKEMIIGINFFVFLLMLNFASLLIEINGSTLRWPFGVGIPFKSVKLNTIKQVDIVRNKWRHGWGIRRIKKGCLYNVAGFDAVEILLKNGKIICLGTDEVKKLAKTINKKLLANLTTEAN